MISNPSMTWPFEGCFLYVLNPKWKFSTRTVNLQDNFFPSFSYVVFCPLSVMLSNHLINKIHMGFA